MLSTDLSDTAVVSVEGGETSEHRISSEILVRVIDGFQNMAWLLGAVLEGRSFTERFRPSEEFKKRHQIEWGVPCEGSYSIPIHSPKPLLQTRKQRPAKIEHYSDLLSIFDLYNAIAQCDLGSVKKFIPDSRARERLFVASQKFFPRAGEDWQIRYSLNERSVILDEKSHSVVGSWLLESLSDQKPEETLTIKGELLRIDFSSKSIVVKYPITHRSIECYYRPEIEDSLLDGRKDLIEVTGKFLLSIDGYPERLTEVSSIQPVDLSQMILSKLEYQERQLALTQPLVFTPFLDEETNQSYVIREENMGVDVHAHTREALMQELVEQIFFLWDQYGGDQIDENSLTKNSQHRRKHLRTKISERRNNA